MSKSKLGRNPFDKGSKPRAAKVNTAKPGRVDATTKKRPKAERAYRRGKGKGFLHFVEEVTHHWVPRLKACAYVRVVKLAAKFS